MSDIFSLKHLIEESFMGSEHPGDDENDIFVVEDFDVPEFMEMIHGNDWKSFLNVLETSEFPLSQSYGGMFYYMSDKAFHYFAPAHLLFSLHENSDTLAGAFFSHLYPQPEIYASQSDALNRRLALFNDQQKLAIGAVVDYFVNVLEPNAGHSDLLEFWKPWITGEPFTKTV